MLYKMDCKAAIAAQVADEPTYIKLDCDLQTLANDDNFYGRLIDCQLAIVTTLVTACTNWNQGIRTTVKIDGQYVTSALVGAINISRRKNQIATFSLQLRDTQYSPLINPHIFPSKEVIIISYLNRYEATLFTGLIDDVQTTWDGDFSISINGSGYGKKLRDARKTLVSIQDSATSKYRGDLVKYLAEQAGIPSSNINTAQGSYTRIDHSFEDQSILDMVNKELVIDSMQWEFDGDKTFNTFLDEIKTSTETYPTADWTYGEDRFFYLGLGNTDDNIVNDIKILGTIYETQIEVENPEDSPSGEYIEPDSERQLCYFSHYFGAGEDPTSWEENDENFSISVSNYGWGVVVDWIKNYKFKIEWNSADYNITYINYTVSEDVTAYGSYIYSNSAGVKVRRLLDDDDQLSAFSINIALIGKSKKIQDTPEEDPDTSAIVDDEDVVKPTYEYKYDQVAAHVTNLYSIVKYGRRKPNTEGTLEFPLAENTDQCRGIGRKIIKDSHRYTKQPTFEVPFNPLLKVGQTISITDKKIGYSQRWYVEEVNHTIEQGKGRTRVGCVYYT